MKCYKCGYEIDRMGISFCPHCNAYLNIPNNSVQQNTPFNNYQPPQNQIANPTFNNKLQQQYQSQNVKITTNDSKKITFKPSFLILIIFVVGWAVAIYYFVDSFNNDYYFEESESKIATEETEIKTDSNITIVGKSKSSVTGASKITFDNQYLNQIVLTSKDDVYKLIINDSVNQKKSCPSNIVKIENEIINNYDIKAVNLCEMNEKFAIELKYVVKYIYDTYPKARGYLTNLTLANVSEDKTFMAAFMPLFTFATSNTSSNYPIGIKTQIILNTNYFLNTSKIENSVKYGRNSGYFPKNATRSSTVAHEFGHYLSYVAMLNYYHANSFTYTRALEANKLHTVSDDFNNGNFSKKLIEEAYSKSSKKTSFDEFRGTISKYALAKDNEGKYIYDETIAEAFHDCYLNGKNAKEASKLIIATLEKYL